MPHCKYISFFKLLLPTRRGLCLFLLIMGGVFIFLHFWTSYTFPKVRTVARSRVGLKRVREIIQNYNEENQKYPNSLNELKKYHTATKPDEDIWFLEVITNSAGVSKESDILDGQGGWYYNNKTGEVKLNITKPIKRYWGFYWGQGRNSTPSDW